MNIEDIILCIYDNANLHEKIKLSQLSRLHYKIIQLFHKLRKTILYGIKNDINSITYHDNYNLFLHDYVNNKVICINGKSLKTSIVSNVLFKGSTCSTYNNCIIDDGIIIYNNNKLKYIKLYPKYKEFILIDKINIHRYYYCDNKLFLIKKRSSTNRKYHYSLECHDFFDDKLELNYSIPFDTKSPMIYGNDRMLFISTYFHSEKNGSCWTFKTLNTFNGNVEFEFILEGNREATFSFISDCILLYKDQEILCSIIEKTLHFKTIYKIPDNYNMIDNDIVHLKLMDCSVFVLVHNYYHDDNENNETIIPEDINYEPACIIVILNNKTWTVIHQEKIYLDYALDFYVVGSTVFIKNHCEKNPKILVYNFENLI